MSLATGLACKKGRGLPLERLVGEAFEGFSEHDMAAGTRIPRAEVQVGQPALSPAATPLGGEDDQVERVCTLDLQPARATPTRLVRRVEPLGHDPLMTRSER